MKPPITTKEDILEAIPLLLLFGFSFASIISVLLAGYVTTINIYIGLGLIILLAILFFVHRRIYKYAMGIFLILANFNIIIFSHVASWISFGSLKICLLPFTITIAYTFIHRNELLNLVRLYTKKEP